MDDFLALFGVPASVILVLAAFSKADDAISEQARVDLARWLKSLSLPVGKSPVVRSVYEMFAWIFGNRHFSLRCVLASAAYSIVILGVVSVSLAVKFDTGVCYHVSESEEFGTMLTEPAGCPDDFVASENDIQSVPPISFSSFFLRMINNWPMLIFFLIFNPISDFTSLAVTRWHLRSASQGRSNLLLTILSDALLSVIAFSAMLSLCWFALHFVTVSPLWAETIFERFQWASLQVIYLFPGMLSLDVSFDAGSDPFDYMLPGTLATAMITSLWLWIALIASALMKSLSKSQSVLSFFQYALNLEKKPLFAIGWFSAILFAAVYLVSSLI